MTMTATPNDLTRIDRELVSDLYLSRHGLQFLETLIGRFGARFAGTDDERNAGRWLLETFQEYGVGNVTLQAFETSGWTRGSTRLSVLTPHAQEVSAIALPHCPSGVVEAPLVYLSDGDPQTYADLREEIRGSIVMVTTATPKFYHRAMHRKEKISRAADAGAIAVLWMRGEPGGLPETGSANFGSPASFPVLSVSYESGQELVRLGRQGQVTLRIDTQNSSQTVTSYNVVAEIPGTDLKDETIVVGAHYDGHDISQGAADNGAGTAVLMEIARALAKHPQALRRTVQLVAFAQEEMGLVGSDYFAAQLGADEARVKFMLNLDGAGRGQTGVLTLQGWPETLRWLRGLLGDMFETNLTVGDKLGLYSDMYPFAARGIPAGTFSSSNATSSAAPRGWGHTAWDSLDKLSARDIQLDALRMARLVLRLATLDELPFRQKTGSDMRQFLALQGLDEVLRYEGRPVPGDDAA